MRFKGTLTEWNDDRGFGFINPAEGGAQVFCHISAFRNRSRRPAKGQVVTYELARDERGRPRAQQIQSAESNVRQASAAASAPRMGRAATVCGLFLLGVAGLAGTGYLHWVVPLWYGVCSLVLFMVYGWDKVSAERGAWRTAEKTLNLMALVGGWPGGWIAQQGFRHKSRKLSFQIEFWIAAAANVALLAWLVSLDGDPFTLLGAR